MEKLLVPMFCVLSCLGCQTADVAGTRGAFSSPAVPATIEQWERSHKRAMVSAHLDEALAAYLAEEDDIKKAALWDQVERLQKLYRESGDEHPYIPAASLPASNGYSAGYPSQSFRISPLDRGMLRMYDKTTGARVGETPVRHSSTPDDMADTPTAKYLYRVDPL